MTAVLKKFTDRYYVRGLARLLYLSRRRSPRIQEITDPDGVRILCDKENYFQCQIQWGNYEHVVRKLIRQLTRPGDTVVDIGCNLGYLSCVAADCTGRNGRVISVDPNPMVIDLTQRNAGLNGFDWIETHCVAAGSRDGNSQLRVGAEHTLSSLLDNRTGIAVEKTIQVPVVRMDDLLADCPGVRLVKIDTEGYEANVLRGMLKLIDANEACFIVEHTGSKCVDSVATLSEMVGLFQQKYSLYWLESKMQTALFSRKDLRRVPITDANIEEISPTNGDFLAVPATSDL